MVPHRDHRIVYVRNHNGFFMFPHTEFSLSRMGHLNLFICTHSIHRRLPHDHHIPHPATPPLHSQKVELREPETGKSHHLRKNRIKARIFKYDKAFGPDSTQVSSRWEEEEEEPGGRGVWHKPGFL